MTATNSAYSHVTINTLTVSENSAYGIAMTAQRKQEPVYDYIELDSKH